MDMDKVIKILESWKTALILLAAYAVVMAAATFAEAAHGTEAAFHWFYNAWWFFILHLILIANFVFVAMRMQLWKRKRFGALLLHCGFIVIIAGAFITHVRGYEGYMHIREGESSSSIIVGNHPHSVPFSVKLNDFRLVRYAGSNSPSSYESHVEITYEGETRTEKIYMNNVARVGGYRIYQTSYDADETGTVLTVSSDSLGTAVTYAGYFMLFLGLLWSLLEPGSRFRALYRSLGKAGIVAAGVFIIGMAGSWTADAQTSNPAPIDAAYAKRFSRLLVHSPDGRIEPVNTYSSEILRKLYHRNNYHGENPDRVLLGIISDPDRWSREPLIYVGMKDVAREFGAAGKHVTYLDLFDAAGYYRLENSIEAIYRKPPEERTKRDKEYIKLDEKASILYALFHGMMLPVFPAEEERWLSTGDDLAGLNQMDSMLIAAVMPWHNTELRERNYASAGEALEMIEKYQAAKIKNFSSDIYNISESRINAEILYNKADIFRMAFRLYLILGFALMIILVSGKNLDAPGRKARLAINAIMTLITAVFACHTFGIALRWYISGQAPWSNGYETMVYVAWATMLAGIFFSRRSRLVFALTSMLAGVVLFVSNLNWLDPQITPLMPVLKSHWLMTHVSVITASYGFFGMSFMCGAASLVAIIRGRSLPDLRRINEMAMLVGLVLLTLGIFFGAIWANESWGRYWGWDPKETWALITMVVYAIATHSHFIPKLNNEFAFGAMSVAGFLSVGMTFFGVNYFLSGLHSYGGGGEISLVAVAAMIAAIAALIAWAGSVYRKTVKI